MSGVTEFVDSLIERAGGKSLAPEDADLMREAALWLSWVQSRADRAEAAVVAAPHDSMCETERDDDGCDCWKSETTA